MLGLALELRSRGHEVLFATNDHFATLVRGYGLEFEPLGTEDDYTACVASPDLWHPRRSFPHIFRCFFPILKRQYAIHAEQAAAGDVVGISNCLGFGALLAQEKLHVPVITLHCQPAVVWSDVEPPALPGVSGPRWMKRLLFRVGERYFIDAVVRPALNPWRAELGLPPMRHTMRWWNSPFGVLCMFPDWFAPPQPDWPRPWLQTDFPLWNHRSDEPLAAEVAQFVSAGSPPIVFTPGTANRHGRAFFEAAVHACQALGRRGILLTEFIEQVPESLPEGVVHFRYVPLDRLLARAAAFVHHGGVGSTSQAMLAGIPQLIMPLAHDQFDNAERVRRLGIGNGLPVPRFTGPRLAERLSQLLGSLATAAACRAVAGRLASREGLSRSAAAIESHVNQFERERAVGHG